MIITDEYNLAQQISLVILRLGQNFNGSALTSQW